MNGTRRFLTRLSQMAAIAAGLAVGAYVDPVQMKAVASELIASLSIAAGIVAQGMVLIATMFQPGRLTPARVRVITAELEKQLRLAGELFLVLAVAIIPLVMLKGEIDAPFISARVGLVFLGVVGGIAIARLITFFAALLALQRLRHAQFLEEALAEETAGRAKLLDRVAGIPARPGLPPYGATVAAQPVQSVGPESRPGQKPSR